MACGTRLETIIIPEKCDITIITCPYNTLYAFCNTYVELTTYIRKYRLVLCISFTKGQVFLITSVNETWLLNSTVEVGQNEVFTVHDLKDYPPFGIPRPLSTPLMCSVRFLIHNAVLSRISCICIKAIGFLPNEVRKHLDLSTEISLVLCLPFHKILDPLV